MRQGTKGHEAEVEAGNAVEEDHIVEVQVEGVVQEVAALEGQKARTKEGLATVADDPDLLAEIDDDQEVGV